MEVLIGILAAMSCLVFFLLGGVCGYGLRARKTPKAPETPAFELTPEEKQRQREELEAWKQMNSYDVSDAYGIHPNDVPRK